MDPKIAPHIALLVGAQLIGLLSLAFRAAGVRRVVASVSLLASAIVLGVTVGQFAELWIIPLAIVGAYQLVNIARIIENRMHLQYLRRQVALSGVIFLLLGVAVSFLKLAKEWNAQHGYALMVVYSIVALAVGLVSFLVVLVNLKKTRVQKSQHFYSDAQLPTVSVLISARNEDEALTECIHMLLQSDYPKLEIIILDDCSQDKSSDVIKGFASKGVRFIQGEQPRENWLAKNQAYETLADAASGEWLLFGGVDVQLGPSTIRALITHALNKKLTMASILPHRTGQNVASSFLAPLRYFWEMGVPAAFHAHKRPSVLSTIWAINKQALHKTGSFSAVSRSVNPEGYFAKKVKSYQFIRSDESIDVVTNKPLRDQYDTAMRTYYPELRRRIHRVAAMTSLGVAVLVLPFILTVVFLLSGNLIPGLIAAGAALLLTCSHLIIVTATNPKAWLIGFFNFPYAALQEMVLLNISMYQYEFSEVIWKGRNICYPVMHVVPRLPNIDDEQKPTK